MRRGTIVAGLGLGLAVAVVALAGEAPAEPAGKKVFLDARCQVCHSVSSQGIAAETEGEASADEPAPPDLSDVGSQLERDFIEKYLLKKETLHERKHVKAFRGSDADREALVAWLASLKNEDKAPAAAPR